MYNKDLYIFTQINGNHFHLLYDKNYNCFKDDNNKLIFNKEKNIYFENIRNNINKNQFKKDKKSNLIDNVKDKNLNINIKNNKSTDPEEDEDEELSEKDIKQLYNDNSNLYKIEYENVLIKFENLTKKEILELYSKNKKK